MIYLGDLASVVSTGATTSPASASLFSLTVWLSLLSALLTTLTSAGLSEDTSHFTRLPSLSTGVSSHVMSTPSTYTVVLSFV